MAGLNRWPAPAETLGLFHAEPARIRGHGPEPIRVAEGGQQRAFERGRTGFVRCLARTGDCRRPNCLNHCRVDGRTSPLSALPNYRARQIFLSGQKASRPQTAISKNLARFFAPIAIYLNDWPVPRREAFRSKLPPLTCLKLIPVGILNQKLTTIYPTTPYTQTTQFLGPQESMPATSQFPHIDLF